MDSITDHYARENNLFRLMEDIGRILTLRPTTNITDNYGNHQLGRELNCANGVVMQVPLIDHHLESMNMYLNAQDASEDKSHYFLGDLPSPLQTRCNAALGR